MRTKVGNPGSAGAVGLGGAGSIARAASVEVAAGEQGDPDQDDDGGHAREHQAPMEIGQVQLPAGLEPPRASTTVSLMNSRSPS